VADGYVLFLSKPTGYVLVEREGEPPAIGSEVDANGSSVRVLKVGPSPIPGDARRCVYSEPA
jgi:hypothetical protein